MLRIPQGLAESDRGISPQEGRSLYGFPEILGHASLHNALAPLAPPNHQRRHEQGDEDGDHKERA